MKRAKGGGSAAKHKGTSHHHATAKHHVSAKHSHPATPVGKTLRGTQPQPGAGAAPVARHPHHPHHVKARGLALGEMVACCTAEALAASIRLAGGSVAETDVLALYRATCSDPEEGQALSVALSAAQSHSLGGYYPAGFGPAWAECDQPLHQGECNPWEYPFWPLRARDSDVFSILGLELPEGPHAVCVGPDGAWWSWGEPYDPASWPDAVVEEAWLVGWSR